jgi:ATP/maltotriose-dependent transcriptional regulator MalT
MMTDIVRIVLFDTHLKMATPLLRTKFYIPPTQPGLVHRPRLTERINQNLARKLTLVSAPPGFGKTTLLSEWIPASQRRVGWLSLEEADNDPMRFWHYFIAALQALHEDLARDAHAFLHAEGQQATQVQFEAAITSLLNDIADFPDEFALVLDDYHRINNPAIQQGLIFLIDHLPPNIHLILTCRADPPLPLARLRARGELIELRSEDLRFTPEEAAAFLNQRMDLNLTDEQVAALEARTEGWIVGLQLAAFSLQRPGDAGQFIESFTGSHRFILDYLMDEVLNRKPESVQSFLLKTSILERLTGPLCDSVTGTNDGQEMLRQLEQSNLFIIPLDVERRWYRYHHLFADLLRRRLGELLPDQVQDLHRRACEWFEREGLLPEAIDHALAMRDFETAARLIEAAAETQRQRGEIATLTGWMNALPGDIRRSQPALCLAYARALVDTAQNLTIEALIEDAEAGLDTARYSNDPGTSSLRGQVTALRAYLAMIRHRFGETIELSRRAGELLGASEARWRSFVGLTLAGAYRFTNDWAAAGQTYLEASDLSRSVGDTVNALLALSLRGEVLQAEGRLRQAAGQYEQVLELAQELAIPHASVTGYASIGLGRAWCEWNDLEKADRSAQRGLDYGRKAGMQDVVLRGYLALARIRQARDDFEGALEALDNAEPAARQMGMAEVRDWIHSIRVQIWLARGETDAAVRWASSYAGDPHDTIYPSIAIALAKARLVQRKPDLALGLLEHALRSAQAVGRLGNAIQILVVKAAVQEAQGDHEVALSTLSQALTLAAPEG